MKQSPIHFAVCTLKKKEGVSRVVFDGEGRTVPFTDFRDDFKCFFNAFVGNWATLIYLVLICISVELKNIEGFIRDDRYECSCRRPKDLE
jgi:hypothetical protein